MIGDLQIKPEDAIATVKDNLKQFLMICKLSCSSSADFRGLVQMKADAIA